MEHTKRIIEIFKGRNNTSSYVHEDAEDFESSIKGEGAIQNLDFGQVYLTEKAVLRPVTVKSHCDEDLLVKLKGDLRSSRPGIQPKLFFQLENENLKEVGDEEIYGPQPDVVSAYFNELFNMVCLEDEFVLKAHESQELVLVLYPCFEKTDLYGLMKKEKEDSMSEATSVKSATTILSEGPLAHTQSTDEAKLNEDTKFNELSGTVVFTAESYLGGGGDPSNETTAITTQLGINAKACLSTLKTNPTELQFNNCVPNQTYVKDFSIRNNSEIPLWLRVVPSCQNGQLEVTDYDTRAEETLSTATGRWLKTYAHMRVRVQLKTQEVGEFEYKLYVENLTNPLNSVELDVIVSVCAQTHREGLSIQGLDGEKLAHGGSLNFGDCYTGITVSRPLKVKNTTDVALDVKLIPDRPEEVTFHLVTDQHPKANAHYSNKTEHYRHRKSYEGASMTDSEVLFDDFGNDSKSNKEDAFNLDVDSAEEENEDEGYEEEERARGQANVSKATETAEADYLDKMDNDDDDDDNDELRRLGRRRKKAQARSLPRSNSKEMEKEITINKQRSFLKKAESRGLERAQQIEELYLAPGAEHILMIHYCPKLSKAKNTSWKGRETVDYSLGKLTRQVFKISFDCEDAGSKRELYMYEDNNENEEAFQYYDRFRRKESISTYTKVIGVRAMVCASIISVAPAIVNMMDCNVGEYKENHFEVTNHSDLPTDVEIEVTSKVISIPDIMNIAPNSTVPVPFEYVARKFNTKYTKKITITNKKNPLNAQEVEVKGCNIDSHHVQIHSHYYKLIVKNRLKQCQVYFGHILYNTPSVRTFTILNTSAKKLHLEISTSTDHELQCYQIKEETSSRFSIRKEPSKGNFLDPWGDSDDEANGEDDEKVLEKKRAKREIHPQISERLSLNSMDLAISPTSQRALMQRRRRKGPAQPPLRQEADSLETIPDSSESTPSISASNKSKREEQGQAAEDTCWSVDQLLSSFEKMPEDDEESQIKFLQTRQKELDKCIKNKRLVHLDPKKGSQNSLCIHGQEEKKIVVLWTPLSAGKPEELTKETVVDKQIYFKVDAINRESLPKYLREADTKKDGKGHSPGDIKVRSMLVRGKLCRSHFSVNQKNINFGKVTLGAQGTQETKSTITLANKSMVPLLYEITKSGKFSSDFLRIPNGRRGVIRAQKTKKIELSFHPTLKGTFEEKLKVVNVQNTDNSESITLKAKVYKPETFVMVSPADGTLDFAACCIGEKSRSTVKITLRNTTSRKREFGLTTEVLLEEGPTKLNPRLSNFTLAEMQNTCDPKFQFTIDNSDGIPESERLALEEKLEKYEQKLKIAQRKKKFEKVKKMENKIQKIKAKLSSEANKFDDNEGWTSMSESESDSDSESLSSRREVAKKPKTRYDFRFSLEADQIGCISANVAFLPKSTFLGWDDYIPFKGSLQIFELKDEGSKKELNYKADVYYNTAAYRAVTGHYPSPPTPTHLSELEFSFENEHVSPEKDAFPTHFEEAMVTTNNDQMETTHLRGPLFPPPSPYKTPGSGAVLFTSIPANFVISPTDLNAVLGSDLSSEGIRVVCSGDFEGNNKLLPTSVFSIHSTSDQEMMIKILWSPISSEGSILVDKEIFAEGTEPFIFSHQSEGTPGLTEFDSVNFVKLHAGNTVDVKMKTSPSLPIPLKPIYGGEVQVKVIDQTEHHHSAAAHLPILLAPPPKSCLSVQRKVNLGFLTVHEKKSACFTVQNVSESSLSYVAMFDRSADKSLQLLRNQTGVIDAGQTHEVYFEFEASATGRWAEEIVVRNLQNKNDQANVMVQAYVKPSMYVHFLDIDPSQTGTNLQIDLKVLYLHDENTKGTSTSSHKKEKSPDHVLPFRIRNVSKDPIYLTAVSNLKKQCYVCSDPLFQQDLESLKLETQSEITVYIGFEPKMPQDYYKSGKCKDLIGGIRFLGHSKPVGQRSEEQVEAQGEREANAENVTQPKEKEDQHKLFECTVKFQGKVGLSILRALPEQSIPYRVKYEPGALALGYKVLRGSFFLENVTKELPLEFQFVDQHFLPTAGETELMAYSRSMPSNSFRVLLLGLSEQVVFLEPAQKLEINYCVIIKHFAGLVQHQFVAENLSSPESQRSFACHNLGVFVDNLALGTNLNQDLAEDDKKKVCGGLKNSDNEPYPRLETVSMENSIWVTQMPTETEEENGARDKASKDKLVNCCILPDTGSEMMKAPPRHRVAVRFHNTTAQDLYLYPYSNLPIKMIQSQASYSQGKGAVSRFLHLMGKNTGQQDFSSTTHNRQYRFRRCGRGFGIKGKSMLTAIIHFENREEAGPLPLDKLEKGQKIPFTGSIALMKTLIPEPMLDISRKPDHVVKLLLLKGSYCRPRLTVQENSIHLGKVGLYHPFKFTISNACENELPVMISGLRQEISVAEEPNKQLIEKNRMRLEEAAAFLQLSPKEDVTVNMKWAFNDVSISSEHQEFVLGVQNLADDTNVANITVCAQVYSKLVEIKDHHNEPITAGHQALVFPQIILPVPPEETAATPGMPGFSVKNIFDEPLSVDIETLPNEVVKGLVEFKAVLISSFSSASDLNLNPAQTVDLRIVCTPKKDAIISRNLFSLLEKYSQSHSENCYHLGEVKIHIRLQREDAASESSPCVHSYEESIFLVGNLVPGPTIKIVEDQSIEINAELTEDRSEDLKVLKLKSQKFSVKVKNLTLKFVECSFHGQTFCAPQDFKFALSSGSKCIITDRITLALQGPHTHIYLNNTRSFLVLIQESTGAQSQDHVQLKLDPMKPEMITGMFFEIGDSAAPTGNAVRESIPIMIKKCDGIDDTLPTSRKSTEVSLAISEDLPEMNRSLGDVQPTMHIGGCTLLSGRRYEYNLGPNIAGPWKIEWDFTLDNQSPMHSLEFELQPIHCGETPWIEVVENYQGDLEPCSSKTIKLSLSREKIGIFSSYLILKNLTNPSDTIVIRVGIEVVEDQSSDMPHLFEVFACGRSYLDAAEADALTERESLSNSRTGGTASQDSKVVVMGDVYVGQLYNRRSLLVWNKAESDLEFQISSNFNKSELVFSLSATTLSQVSRFTIEPKRKLQVFLHFFPIAGVDSSQISWEKTGKICLSCRLVKDFQREIQVKAVYHQPLLGVYLEGTGQASSRATYGDSLGLLFKAGQKNIDARKKSSADSQIGASSEQNAGVEYFLREGYDERAIMISNENPVTRQHSVKVGIRNDTEHFVLRPGAVLPKEDVSGAIAEVGTLRQIQDTVTRTGIDHFTLKSKGEAETVITLEIPYGCAFIIWVRASTAKLGYSQVLLNSQVVQEHITIYNLWDLSEKYRVTLRISTSDLTTFFLCPAHQNAFPFSALEGIIIQFLQDYETFWPRFKKAILTRYSSAQTYIGDSEEENKETSVDSFVSEHKEEPHTAVDFYSLISDICLERYMRRYTGGIEEDSFGSEQDWAASFASELHDLFFGYHYIVDELVYYSLIHEGYVGNFAIQLAHLLFKVVFQHQIFQGMKPDCDSQLLLDWIKLFDKFLDYFPPTRLAIKPLFELRLTLARD